MFELRDYQCDAIDSVMSDLTQHDKCAVLAPTGCLAGDTKIKVNRSKGTRTYTIKRLYNLMHGNPDKLEGVQGFREGIENFIRSYNGSEIRLHKMLDCVYSGKKKIFELELEDGKKIKATECHKFLTKKGFIPLGKLDSTHEIMVDTPRASSSEILKAKVCDYFVCNLWYHPHASKVRTTKAARGWTKRIELHRFVYEAHLNNLSHDEYKSILRTDEDKAKTLQYIDPNTHHIHHKDDNHYNNEIKNLEVVEREYRYKYHGNHRFFNQGQPVYSKVKSISYAGIDDTYDITCADPYHNFSANDIIVHNSGKTMLMMEISKRFIEQNPDKSVMILSHLSILTDQTTARFETFYPEIKTGILQAKLTPDWNSRVVVSTMQSSRIEYKVERFKDQAVYPVGLIIIDECHLLYSQSYDQVLSYFPGIKVVGFTATPYRNKAIMTGWFDKISYSISMKELIDMGYLVQPVLCQIKKRGDNLEDIINTVVSLYKEKESGRQAVVYMQTIEDAKLLRNVLHDKGVPAACVTSDIVRNSRNKIFEDFDKRKINVLTTVNVLSLGFDSPCIEVIVQPYATGSPINYIQRIGRGLRPYKNKTECRVYVFGTAPSIKRRIFEKLNTVMMYGEKKKEHDTYTDDWELNYWDERQEIYHWTKTVVECIAHMKRVGMPNFAEMLDGKRFPPKFMENIKDIIDKLPSRKPCVAGGQYPATDSQLTLLSKLGWDLKDLSYLTKGEASAMISVMYSGKTNPEWDKWVLQSGKFRGVHISQVPYTYRNMLLTDYRFKNSNAAQMLRDWNKRRQGL